MSERSNQIVCAKMRALPGGQTKAAIYTEQPRQLRGPDNPLKPPTLRNIRRRDARPVDLPIRTEI